MVRHCANFTVTFAYLTTQELYVTFACLIHHSSHRFRTQSLVTLRHSNIGLQPQGVSTLLVLCVVSISSCCCSGCAIFFRSGYFHLAVPPATFAPVCSGRFMQPGLLVLADSHTCPQSSTVRPFTHSLTHSLTDHPLLCSTSTITTCCRAVQHVICSGASVHITLLLQSPRTAPRTASCPQSHHLCRCIPITSGLSVLH